MFKMGPSPSDILHGPISKQFCLAQNFMKFINIILSINLYFKDIVTNLYQILIFFRKKSKKLRIN